MNFSHYSLFQVRLICSASAPLQSIFIQADHDSGLDEKRVLMDDLGLSQVSTMNISAFVAREHNWFGSMCWHYCKTKKHLEGRSVAFLQVQCSIFSSAVI